MKKTKRYWKILTLTEEGILGSACEAKNMAQSTQRANEWEDQFMLYEDL